MQTSSLNKNVLKRTLLTNLVNNHLFNFKRGIGRKQGGRLNDNARQKQSQLLSQFYSENSEGIG